VWSRLKNLNKDIDWVLLGCTIALTVIGIRTIGGVLGSSYVLRQGVSAVIGLVALGVGFWLPVRYYRMVAPHFYAACVFLLVALLVLSGSAVKRWIFLGPLSFQPSELAKLATILMLARLYDERQGDRSDLYYFILALIIAIVPAALVVKEPDLGTGLVFGGIFLFMAFWAGHDLMFILLLCSPIVSIVTAYWMPLWGAWIILLMIVLYVMHARPGVMIGGMLVNIAAGVAASAFIGQLHDYQIQRLKLFLDPTQDPTRGGYQIIQSLITIGHGGILG
jgi:rod shape determining protein RodA